MMITYRDELEAGMNKFEALQALIDQYRQADPFFQADFLGKTVPARYVAMVLKAVEDGTYVQSDVSFEQSIG